VWTGRNSLVTKYSSWRNSSNRRLIIFHVAHLYRWCMRTQQNIGFVWMKKYLAYHAPDGIPVSLMQWNYASHLRFLVLQKRWNQCLKNIIIWFFYQWNRVRTNSYRLSGTS
jgi:hypothetical protein